MLRSLSVALLALSPLAALPAGAVAPNATPADDSAETSTPSDELAQRRGRRRGGSAAEQASETSAQHTFGEDPWGLTGQPVLGALDATVTIVVFSDFQCPFCSRGADTMHALLQDARWADDLRVVFMHFPLAFHQDAEPAARASIAAHAQGSFWPYHDLLFENQQDLGRNALLEHAQSLGLDVAAFEAAMDDPASAELVQAQMAMGQSLGVRGTPNFFINGQLIVGAQPSSEFEPIILAEQAAMAALMEAGATRDEALVARLEAAGGAAPTAAPEPSGPSDEQLAQRVYIDLAGRPSQGPEEAPIVIVQFGDYECPFTSRAEETVLAVMAEYPDDVRRVWLNYPLESIHPLAHQAARVARAAYDAGGFWELHALMVANPTALNEPDLVEYVTEAGLDLDAIAEASSEEPVTSQLDLEAATARNVLVQGTPTFFVNGRRISGAQPIETFREAIDAALEEAQPLLDAGTPPTRIYEEVLADAPSSIRMADN